jgi:hypothetical protein
MIYYQPIKNQKIKIAPKSTVQFDKVPAVLIPMQPGKLYLHWYNQNQKLMKTLTLDYATKVFHPVHIVSGHDQSIEILSLELDKT